jgi:hypothetical protein
MLAELHPARRDAEPVAFQAGREHDCEREADEVEWRGGRVYLHLGGRRDDRRTACRSTLAGCEHPIAIRLSR